MGWMGKGYIMPAAEPLTHPPPPVPVPPPTDPATLLHKQFHPHLPHPTRPRMSHGHISTPDGIYSALPPIHQLSTVYQPACHCLISESKLDLDESS